MCAFCPEEGLSIHWSDDDATVVVKDHEGEILATEPTSSAAIETREKLIKDRRRHK
ncbi:hypothetical protein K378_01432 [Streptomyces sp. Amel2xB2]|nr:hypothetical protein K378_01432 [Streptomyces sp. Amel2xB2]